MQTTREEKLCVLNSMGVSFSGSLAASTEHLALRERAVLSRAGEVPSRWTGLTEIGEGCSGRVGRRDRGDGRLTEEEEESRE